jgi:cytidyltransferase-like protein
MQKINIKRGVIAGNFDVLHPGYIAMFEECKKYCDRLIVCLHEDPSIERPEKLKPILHFGVTSMPKIIVFKKEKI